MFRCSNKSKLGKVKFDFFLVLTATVESSLIGYTMAMRWPKQFHTASVLMILMNKNRGWIGGGRFTHIHWPGQSMVMGVWGGTLLGSQILIWYAAHYPTAFQSKLISQRVFTGHKHPRTQRGHLLMAKDLDVFFAQVLIMSFQIISLHRDGHTVFNQANLIDLVLSSFIQHVASENPSHFTNFLSDDCTLWANYTKVRWLKTLVQVVWDSDIRTFEGSQASKNSGFSSYCPLSIWMV